MIKLIIGAGLRWLLGKLWPGKTPGQVKAETQNAALEEIVKRVNTAEKARQRVRSDPVERERVSDKYRRK